MTDTERTEREQALRLADILEELDDEGRKKLLNVGEIMIDALAEKYHEYSFSAEHTKTTGDGRVEAELREGLTVISELLKELGFREGTDYERVKKEYTRDDGFRFGYWVIKPMA